MKKYDDEKIDALLKKAAGEKESLDASVKDRLYEKIEAVGISQNKKQGRLILRYAAAAILFIGIIAAAVYIPGRLDKKTESNHFRKSLEYILREFY